MVRISVIICVYTERRWNDIVAAVRSAQAQQYSAHEIIVVVDHNTNLLNRLEAELDGVTLVANQQPQGLSGGRNTGVAAASGDVVAFLDDDAIADPAWLEHFAESYSDPDVVGVGGKTLPNWDDRRPSWFPGEFDWTVGCAYIGMPTDKAEVRNILGGNASYRRCIFEIVGGFNNALGRSGSKLPLGCEETEFCIRVRQNMKRAVFLYEPQAVIWHRVPVNRATFSYFRSRCYAEGISKSLVSGRVGTADGLSTERSYVLRVLPQGMWRGMGDGFRTDVSGLGRAAAIAVGLTVTAVGFIRGIPMRRSEKIYGVN